jgi:hypothetical protein
MGIEPPAPVMSLPELKRLARACRFADAALAEVKAALLLVEIAPDLSDDERAELTADLSRAVNLFESVADRTWARARAAPRRDARRPAARGAQAGAERRT